jgi:hypothetical protein
MTALELPLHSALQFIFLANFVLYKKKYPRAFYTGRRGRARGTIAFLARKKYPKMIGCIVQQYWMEFRSMHHGRPGQAGEA